MGLSDDEKKLLDELTAKASAPDVDDNFEIEVYDTTNGRGARLPFAKGKSWLFANFGIGEAPAAAPQGGAPDGGGAAGSDAAPGGEGGASRPGYFGRKESGKP